MNEYLVVLTNMYVSHPKRIFCLHYFQALEKSQRYDSLITLCKSVSGPADLTHFARSLPAPTGRGPILKRIFVPPQPPPPPEGEIQELQPKVNLIFLYSQKYIYIKLIY